MFDSGGVSQSVTIFGRGYTGTPDERRRAGLKIEPSQDEVVQVIVRDVKDPVLPACLDLLDAKVFMEHTVQISGIGHIEPPSPGERCQPVTLELGKLSVCKAVERR